MSNPAGINERTKGRSPSSEAARLFWLVTLLRTHDSTVGVGENCVYTLVISVNLTAARHDHTLWTIRYLSEQWQQIYEKNSAGTLPLQSWCATWIQQCLCLGPLKMKMKWKWSRARVYSAPLSLSLEWVSEGSEGSEWGKSEHARSVRPLRAVGSKQAHSYHTTRFKLTLTRYY